MMHTMGKMKGARLHTNADDQDLIQEKQLSVEPSNTAQLAQKPLLEEAKCEVGDKFKPHAGTCLKKKKLPKITAEPKARRNLYGTKILTITSIKCRSKPKFRRKNNKAKLCDKKLIKEL